MRRKLRFSNYIMIFGTLILMLGLSGVLFPVLKKSVLYESGKNIQLSQHTGEAEDYLKETEADGDWEQLEKGLKSYGFSLYVEDEEGKQLYSGLNRQEEKCVAQIRENIVRPDYRMLYFQEQVTVIRISRTWKEQAVTLFAASSPQEGTALGMDRDMFWLLLINLLMAGGITIAVMMLCSQLLSRKLIKKPAVHRTEGRMLERVEIPDEEEWEYGQDFEEEADWNEGESAGNRKGQDRKEKKFLERESTELIEFVGTYAQKKREELLVCQEPGKEPVMLVFDRDRGPHYVNVDQVRMIQVFDQIIGNSLRFAGAEKPRISLRVFGEGDGVCIQISDNGKGMEEDGLPRLFEQFYRGKAEEEDEKSMGKNAGGLGMYVCKYVVEAHGGSICAENRNGLVVNIRLPEIFP